MEHIGIKLSIPNGVTIVGTSTRNVGHPLDFSFGKYALT